MTTVITEPKAPSEANVYVTSDLWNQVDRLVRDLHDDWFGALWPTPASRGQGEAPFLPALVDVEDKGSAFEVTTDLPGVAKDQVDVRVLGDALQIRGVSAASKTAEGKTFVRRERAYQGFQRAIELPEPVLGEKVEARLENGTLTVTVPKARPILERKVPVA